ncbi:MAG: ligand-binding protein [Flavobacteriaceae bacterium]|mgnify:CR=1 FL=1|nr:ligand-binding protein [Flavobacteriaceae bacterium]|tara:strand:+ start:26148 stop:26921 length:774 start_codon:yes stop_codon:yes gene_type:complete
MKNLTITLFLVLLFGACSTKNQLIYIKDSDKYDTFSKVDHSLHMNLIMPGDILKIDVQTIVPEAALPYNKFSSNQAPATNMEILQLEGYRVDEFGMINFPIIGKISVDGLSENDIESKITSLLLDGNHLTNPNVKVRRLNSKFTVLGEVRNPGTFSYFDQKLNIFQALGYAGDLTIDGKRRGIKLIREENGVCEIYNIELTKAQLLNRPVYFIRNNDVIIVNPSFSKVKSAGFIGSPASLASIATLLLSIALLITNN